MILTQAQLESVKAAHAGAREAMRQLARAAEASGEPIGRLQHLADLAQVLADQVEGVIVEHRAAVDLAPAQTDPIHCLLPREPAG